MRPPKVRQRARRDRNHSEVVRTFERLGGSWLDLSGVAGALDGILGTAGVDVRVEIKDGELPPSKNKLTPAEDDVFSTWRGRPPEVVKTIEEAVNLVNQLRREGHAAMGKKAP